jgi:hypothetical protein
MSPPFGGVRDMTLDAIIAEEAVRTVHARTLRAVRRAEELEGVCTLLCQRDGDLLAQSRELIALGRRRVAAPITSPTKT